MHDEQESLEDWARRREERQNASKGKRRAVPLTEGPHRGQHVAPDAPRVIQEWDGTEWETVSLVSDLAEAKTVLYPPQPAEQKAAEWDRPALEKGRGRHRKPTPAENREQQQSIQGHAGRRRQYSGGSPVTETGDPPNTCSSTATS
ncbi:MULTISPECIES: DUF6087 family protein [unclassified Streptomyces]|uniref:DUF6087 family protein n=1 Tax=Streptomyces sp. NBC_00119 TaxID=2975659 RepID=A0AAU1U224_9ACTN|nr:DUF6087 family protein [Streptomyces sp. NBC_00569]WSE13385.1 DUF6087 family protein [Streptomyces sp. NBC_01397]WUB97698.1 DUF6087 family protein [Streptomyces sp. NBC_00569]